MPVTKTPALPLVDRLRGSTEQELVGLLELREIRRRGIRDFFDLADALLDTGNVRAALARLDRSALICLGALAHDPTSSMSSAEILAWLNEREINIDDHDSACAELYRVALIHGDGTRWGTFAQVGTEFAAVRRSQLGEFEAFARTGPPEPARQSATEQHDRIAAEHAFQSIGVTAGLLNELEDAPARELARGGIAVPDLKRLASRMAVPADAVRDYLELASRAGLATLDGSYWVPTVESAEWLLEHAPERWAALGMAWLAGIPEKIRPVLLEHADSAWGTELEAHLKWLYPAGGQWVSEKTHAVLTGAARLGVTAAGRASAAGAAILAGGANAAATAIAPLFPSEVGTVYLQHDLSVVSTGPLRAEVDVRLRGMANVESRALASTYRISAASINRALATGETAASIRSFLSGISMSGVPQPLEYLIAGTAARYGALRVGAIRHDSDEYRETGARSYVRSDDASLIATVLVDQSLSPLGLRKRESGRAASTFAAEVLFWALNDARYPVAAEDSDGSIAQLRRHRPLTAHPAVSEPACAELVRSLLDSADSSDPVSDEAWLERKLELAIRTKTRVTLTVRMPDGSEVELLMEPASLSKGRLRARDPRSDLERTLPLSSIVAVGQPTEA